MQVESLESRTFLSAGGNTVTVPAQYRVTGNLFANTAEGTAAHLGKFTGSFNPAGTFVFVAANGDELWAQATSLGPTGVEGVWHTEGYVVGGTGRFSDATGVFSHDIFFTDAQGDYVVDASTFLTLPRPWSDNA
jgi:hypothetical protein